MTQVWECPARFAGLEGEGCNRALLRRVLARIEAQPWQVEMEVSQGAAFEACAEQVLSAPQPGASACIAGWAEYLARADLEAEFAAQSVTRTEGVIERAQIALDLWHGSAERLFFVGGWPASFVKTYRCMPPLTGRETAYRREVRLVNARVVAARVRRFLETGGCE